MKSRTPEFHRRNLQNCMYLIKCNLYRHFYKFIAFSCGQLSQNSNFRENASNIKGSKHRSSDLISKNSSLKAYKSNQSNSMSQDPIRSITLTEKVKDSRSTNKCKCFSFCYSPKILNNKLQFLMIRTLIEKRQIKIFLSKIETWTQI